MTVFISWSGERSKAVAHAFKKHLEYVIQGLPTFMSDKDIASGTQWFQEINEKLRKATFGIVCVTPENLEQPWLSFEAGALGNQAEQSRVVPVVFGMSKDNLPSPLNGFHAVDLDEDGFLRLIQSIHEALEYTTKLTVVESAAHSLWPEIEAELKAIPARSDAVAPAPDFDMEDAIKEMRGLLRDLVGRKEEGLPDLDPEWLARMERGFMQQRHSAARAAVSPFGRPSVSRVGQINALLHAYSEGDLEARAELIQLGVDPEKESPFLAAVSKRKAEERRAASSEEHDQGHLD
jgi:hypothetical protein